MQKKLATKEELNFKVNAEEGERDIFHHIILPNLEVNLEGGKPYICGYDFCIADIAYYNELFNIFMILEE